jgi:hypothetical protein
MPKRKPPACKNKPDDIADCPQFSCSNIISGCQNFAINDFSSKREKRKIRQHEAGSPPRSADDCYKENNADNRPRYPRYQAAEYKPDEIAYKSHAFLQSYEA